MTESNKICENFRLAMWDLVFNPDEVKDKGLLATYKKHLENCLSCTGAYEQVKAIADELKQVKLPEPPADLQDKIRNRLSAISRKPLSLYRFVRYTTAASVLAAIFVLLLIFAPSQTLPEAVAEASKLHNMYVNGEINTLAKMTSYNELSDYCNNVLSLPDGMVPKVDGDCTLICCCECAKVCNCLPENCEVAKFTNKGAWLVFATGIKPLSLIMVKSVVKLPDSAKRSMEGMDCYAFPVKNLMVCAYSKEGVTYFWVSELGEEEMHKIIVEAMKR